MTYAQSAIDEFSEPNKLPQIAISVYIEKGGHGSTLATIAKAVLDEYFNVGEISEVTIYENKLS